MLINARPGVRITDTPARGDRRRQRPFPPRHLACRPGTSMPLSASTISAPSSVGPWQSYATAAYNSTDHAGRHARAQSRPPRRAICASSLRPRCPTTRRSASTACASARPASTARSGPAIQARCSATTPRPKRSKCARAIAPLQTPALDPDAHGCNRLQQCQRAGHIRADLSRPHPHLQPEQRLPAAGQFWRHQLSHRELATGARHPRRLANGDDFTVACSARRRNSPR